MNKMTVGIGSAVGATLIVVSAMVFANRSTDVATTAEAPQAAATHTECTDEKVVTNKDWGTKSVVGTALGGIAGGVLGHQIGGGRGKDIATVAGAAGGAYAGHEVAKKEFPDQQVSTREHCRQVPG